MLKDIKGQLEKDHGFISSTTWSSRTDGQKDI